MMKAYIAVGHRNPDSKINTTFEAQEPRVFLHLVMEPRSSDPLRATAALNSLAQPLPMALSQLLDLPIDAVKTQPRQEGEPC